jgi:hypothetical protein
MIEVLKLALKALNAGEHAHLIMNTDGIKDKVRQAIAELESQEPVGFAGIEMWIGNTRIKKLMTQAELHYAIDPWAIVKFNADSCIDALKEKNSA